MYKVTICCLKQFSAELKANQVVNSMAVSNNPYQNWLREKGRSDYRSRTTQIASLVRQMMTRPEYLRTVNRVNPGPQRNTRAAKSDLYGSYPERVGTEDLWGWQPWAEEGFYRVQSELSSNLFEESGVITGQLIINEQPVEVPDSAESIIITTPPRGFNYTQTSPSISWEIEHNLGFYPSVELLDNENMEMEGNVVHVSVNLLRVLFNIPVSGRARLA